MVGGGVAAAGLAAGAFAAGRATAADGSPPADSRDAFAFRGEHQAGITTPAQDRLHFAAFDVTTGSRAQLVALLKAWTEAADRMTRGLSAGEIGPTEGSTNLPPDDTGEAIGLDASGLTITFGFGPTLFRDDDGKDRFGLAARQPKALRTLPHFPADVLDPEKSYGDLCVQACADDPQVAVHAIRNLARIGFGTVAVRWSQLGFGRTSTTSTSQSTPRNLFGFKDGTANIKAEETKDVEEHVWVASGADAGADWLAGGSYLVARRFNMNIEIWDRQTLGDQEDFVGRTKDTGAPLSGGTEFTEPDFTMPGSTGPVIAKDAHIRLVHPDFNNGARMLRRGYNFVDGSNPLGGLDAGLFFIAYVTDPDTHFIPIQNTMAKSDALMEYLKVTGSAMFAVPPGIGPGEYVGQPLFDG
ncbi:iron uptake transporter deferrochelatase/peroxidase subunit [Nocardioides hankookensis]|uniref:Deferrochelatase n=1 Tax=Nocardioides hankookensis TaxID=443157 RepID=A0ABW1LH89_9ACTN